MKSKKNQYEEETPTNSLGSFKKYLIISIDDHYFAIDAKITKDILKIHKFKPIPLSPNEIIGVFNLRGKIVTVVDLRYKIGLGETSVKSSYKNVVIEHDNVLYSFLADEVIEVIDVFDNEIVDSPYNSFIKNFNNMNFGVFSSKDRLIIILDIDVIMESHIKDKL